MSIKIILSNKVFRNFSYLTIGSILGQLLSLYSIYYITNLITPEFYGIYAFLISQGILLFRVSSFGNNNIVIRKIARDKDSAKNVAFSTLVFRILFILISSLLYILYNHYFGQLDRLQLILIVLYAVANSLCYLIEWVFTGLQNMKTIAVVNFATNLIWLILVLFFINENSEPNEIFVFYVLSFFIKALFYIIMLYVKKIFLGQHIRDVRSTGLNLNKESWPYFAMLLLLIPISNLDNNFLDLNSTEVELGYYNLAKRLIGPFSLLNTMLITAIFPNISSMWVDDRNKFSKVLSNGFPLFILLFGSICFGFCLFCNEVVDLLFKKEYKPAVIVCQIQIWYFLFFSIDFLMGTFLGASNKEKLILKFAIIYSIICTPSMFLGSYYGATGISLALLISFMLSMLFSWFMFKNVINLKMRTSQYTFFVIFILMALSYLITQIYVLNFLYKLLVLVIVLFCISAYVIKQFKKLSF